MKIIDVDADEMNWPSRCCRCGSKTFEVREHEEKVVRWTTLSVTKYRQVLLNIPVCSGCANASLKWYGAAIVLAAIGYAILSKSVGPTLFLFIVAIVCAWIGTRSKPIKVMGFNDDKNTMRIKIYNDAVATEMRRQAQRPRTS